MKHLGDFDASTLIYGKFTTYRPSTGASFTLAGTPVLSVYKDNSTTQSTTGVTLTADFDAVTGLNHYAVDTSADGTFYSAGSFFDIVVTTGTVDSVSVTGTVVGSFTIRKNSALKPATAGRTVVVDAAGLVDANMVKAGPTGSGAAVAAGAIPNAVAGAAGGLFIAGSNAATTYAALVVTGQTTYTGNMIFSDGITVSAPSTNGRPGLSITGKIGGGGVYIEGGSTGHALQLVGGSTSGVGMQVYTTSGDGINVTPNNGFGCIIQGSGASKHGLYILGGTSGVSDGIRVTAGTGGVDIRSGITGDITGNLSGSVGSVTGLTAANLDVAVSTRASQTSLDTLDDFVDTEVAAIKAKTDNLPAAPAAVGDIPTATQNADALLNRDMSAVSDTTARSPLNALRFLRNLWSISGTTLTVKKEDDSTTAWTSVVTPAPGADPISGSDPA